MKTSGICRLDREGPSGAGLSPLDLDPADFQSDLPEQRWHLYHEDEAAGLYIGVWTTTDMQEAFGPYPGDEFMILLEGDVEILDADGAATRIAEGQRFAIRNGSPVSWKQVGFCRKFFVIHAPPVAERGAVEKDVRILDPAALMGALGKADASAPEFADLSATGFVNATGAMSVGLGETAGAAARTLRLARHHMIEVTEGALSVAEPGATPQVLEPGDVAFLRAGTTCTVSAEGTARFLYCAVDPA